MVTEFDSKDSAHQGASWHGFCGVFPTTRKHAVGSTCHEYCWAVLIDLGDLALLRTLGSSMRQDSLHNPVTKSSALAALTIGTPPLSLAFSLHTELSNQAATDIGVSAVAFNRLVTRWFRTCLLSIPTDEDASNRARAVPKKVAVIRSFYSLTLISYFFTAHAFFVP
jgi:hypothetical protein